jgi:hypothetical protein
LKEISITLKQSLIVTLDGKQTFTAPASATVLDKFQDFIFISQVSMQPTPNTQMADSAANNSTDSSLSLVHSLHPNPQNREHSNMTHSGLCKLHTTNYIVTRTGTKKQNKKAKTGTYYQVSSDTL